MWGTGAEKNPPVTASPCQPPLGKGAKETGDADCHGQFANWPRNDTLYEMRYESGRATARVAPTEGCKGYNGRTEASAPTKAYLAVHRGGALPLPRATARVAPTEGYKGYNGRADVGSELSAAGGG